MSTARVGPGSPRQDVAPGLRGLVAAAVGAFGMVAAASAQGTAQGTAPQPGAASAGSPAQGAPAGASTGRIWRKGSPPVTVGPATNFTGTVRVLAPYRATGESRIRGATVTFEPGARSAWHRHPLGQVLIVTEGCGWTQREGTPIEKICAGDVAWVAPGEMHWHGATLTSAMTHVTAAETVEGRDVQWLEQVPDEEYRRGPD